VALVLGVVATQRGLGLAVDLGAGVITLLSLATIGLLATLGNAMSRDAFWGGDERGYVDYPFVNIAASVQPIAPFPGADGEKSA
jgi:hypothetical protein